MPIREARPTDAAAIAAVQTAAWRDSYRGIVSDAYLDGALAADTVALWQRIMASAVPGRVILVADGKEGLSGFVCILPPRERLADTLADRLATLYVRAESRGRGLGSALLAAALARRVALGATALEAEVLAENGSARAFYRHLGAEEGEPYSTPLPDGRDALEIRVRWPDLAALGRAIRQRLAGRALPG